MAVNLPIPALVVGGRPAPQKFSFTTPHIELFEVGVDGAGSSLSGS